jgi:beta-lactamase class A
MHRRRFNFGLLCALAATLPLPACAQQQGMNKAAGNLWQDLEASVSGRLGVALLDTSDGEWQGQRLDERFPMCSTYKWLAAAFVLHRVDAGKESLTRRVRFGREALLPYSPSTSQHVEGDGMTVAQLCEAAITASDNAAGNLLLESFGGPAALTHYARTLGDAMTRLDRIEPELNEAALGDPRDTTTPRAMATALRATMVGDALSPGSRQQLVQWMEATTTNGRRLRASLRPGWRMGSKTGTGARGSTNDVGVFWPPGRPPIIAAVYLTDTDAAAPARDDVIASVARRIAGSAS